MLSLASRRVHKQNVTLSWNENFELINISIYTAYCVVLYTHSIAHNISHGFIVCVLVDTSTHKKKTIKCKPRTYLMGYIYSAIRWLDTSVPDNKVHGAYMGPTWGRQDPGGPHVGHTNIAIWGANYHTHSLKRKCHHVDEFSNTDCTISLTFSGTADYKMFVYTTVPFQCNRAF